MLLFLCQFIFIIAIGNILIVIIIIDTYIQFNYILYKLINYRYRSINFDKNIYNT